MSTDELLHALVEGTASETGEDFFRSLVRNLATTLRVRYAFVSEFTDVNTRVRTLAFWAGEGFLDNFEYDLADTPCEQVLCGEMRHYAEGVQALFPRDKDLVKLGAESYLAIPLINPSGTVLGHLAVIDDKPMPGELRDISIFKIFGARAGAELERQRAEGALRKAHDDLERRVEERTAELRMTNVSLVQEVSERQRAEVVLRESEARYRALYEGNPSMYFTVDPGGTILSVNPFGAEQLGYTVDELVGQSVLNVIYEEDREAILQQLSAFGMNPTRVADWEFRKLRKDGSVLWVKEAARAVQEANGKTVVLIVCEDITERQRAEEALRQAHDELERRVEARTAALSKTVDILEEQVTVRKRAEEELRKSEEQLRALSGRLLSVQEEERTRLAREIHDELGAALTALRIELAWVGQRLPAKEKGLQNKIQTMTQLVDRAVQAVRRIATELRPGVLDHLGLVAGLEWQVREFQERTGIECIFTRSPEDITVDSARATTVFRICQEALTNVARHANATRTELSLREVETDLVLEVRDDGVGIPEGAITDPKSLGLMGMRERVLPWGGEVRIQGTPGEGTVVTVYLPLEHREARLTGGIS